MAPTQPGANFGFPYCHADGKVDVDFKKEDACKGVTRPAHLMGPHAAVMGVKFYTGKMFPAEYQNTMFIARKGSWNRSTPNGFDVVNVRAGADGKNAKMTAFLTGFNEAKDGYKFWGPAGVHRADARRRAAGQRRAGGRHLPHQLPEARGRRTETEVMRRRLP